jgi:hypothetical protein
MTLQVQMVDFVAERLAREDAAETKALFDNLSDEEEEEGDGKIKKKKKKKKKMKKKKKKLTKKQEMERFNRKEKGLPSKKKRKKKSVFDVVALPEELERLVEEQTRVVKEIEFLHPPVIKKKGNSR